MKINSGYLYQHSGIGNLEGLKGRKDPEAIKTAAREMEALFAYELIKAMRKIADTNSESGLGSGIYMSMFDMELARLMAERGLGLQDMLLKVLNQTSNANRQRSDKDGNSESSIQDATSDHRTSSLPVNGVVTSDYGMRKHPIYGYTKFHHGIDIAAPEGSDIYPIRKGKVVFSGKLPDYGNVVMIDHGDGFVSKYAHNSINLVNVGDIVDSSTVIARVGSTGLSTAPHLHLEVRYKNESIDPLKVIAMR